MDIAELWNLSPDRFNEWRRENDLLKLFEHFRTVLPRFEEWMQQYNLTIPLILRTDRPGQFFFNEVATVVVGHPSPGFFEYSFYPLYSGKDSFSSQPDETLHMTFLPYLPWIKRASKKKKVISDSYETFRYTLYNSEDPESSEAFLSTGFQVLKMGGIRIEGWGNFLLRNLDFCNMDYLQINDGFDLSRQHAVYYSTCRYWKIAGANGSFKSFYQCHFEGIQVEASQLYGFEFYKGEIFGAAFKDCRLANFRIEESLVSLFKFENTLISDFHYIHSKRSELLSKSETSHEAYDMYRSLRILFQTNGLRREVSKAYYRERLFEMIHVWDENQLWHSLKILAKDRGIYYRGQALYYAKKLTSYFSSLMSYLLWGFGERPGQILFNSIFVIILYTTFYYCSKLQPVEHDWVNSLYFSTVTFTTLGYGDISPIHSSSGLKLLVGSEALIGAFFIGLFVAGFSNRSRY
jgi:hypothetical protein